MEAETTRLREATTTLKAEEKELRQALREGTSQMPIPELRAAVAVLQQEKLEVTARLTKLKSGSIKPVSLEEREKTNGDHRKWAKKAAARKKIRRELWAEMQGHLEKDQIEETKESMGLEF